MYMNNQSSDFPWGGGTLQYDWDAYTFTLGGNNFERPFTSLLLNRFLFNSSARPARATKVTKNHGTCKGEKHVCQTDTL